MKKRAFASWKTVSKFSFMLGTLSLVKKKIWRGSGMKKRILKILFLPTEGNDREEILVVVNGQLFQVYYEP